jgi:murein DD-endopeptidase MepM/ murein hydrolase activator NlpD
MKKSKLVLVRSNESNIREYTLSKTKITVLSSLLAIVLFSFIYLVAEIYVENKNTLYIQSLRTKNLALKKEFARVDSQIEQLKDVLSQIKDLDDQLRLTNSLETIDTDVRTLGIGGSEINYYLDENLNDREKSELKSKRLTLDELERQLGFEKKSLKDIYVSIKLKEDSLKYLPSIMPIPEETYRVTRKFGYRMFHPILKRERPHKGIDIGCSEGTPIYAAADGIIEYSGNNAGYGLYVKIGHRTVEKDFGYTTSYAHMSKIHVKRGQRVKRGEMIGEVGSTGLSTAPHLHYEVSFKGKSIKPDEYYYVNIK